MNEHETEYEPDLEHCPKCGGPADNGHDRCIPPNPYYCTECMAGLQQEMAERASRGPRSLEESVDALQDRIHREGEIARAAKSVKVRSGGHFHEGTGEYISDKERLDWLQKAADRRKVELARSIYGTGYEIGEWPSMKVTVKTGSIRDAIDAAIKSEEENT